MKKITCIWIAVLFLSAAFQACRKKEPAPDPEVKGPVHNDPPVDSFPQTKNALFLYYSGSQCNPCGTTGIPNYDNVLASCGSKTVPVVVHCNAPAYDSLYESTVGGELLSLIISGGAYSAPTFLVPSYSKFSGAASSSASSAINYINAFTADKPDASSRIQASVNAGVLEVTTRTKFFNAVNGQYKVGVWVVEDGVVFEQVANSKKIRPYTHNEVLRARLSSSAFGDQIANGDVAADQVFEKKFNRKLPVGVSRLKTWNPDNLTIVCVIWKHSMNGSQKVYEVVNVQQLHL